MKNGDRELIEKFLEYCAKRDMNLKAIASLIKMTPAWASYLVNGKIHRLHFQTRNRIKSILKDTGNSSKPIGQAKGILGPSGRKP